MNVRVGIGTSEVRNRWADAIMLENGVVSIVEAKLQPDPGIFSQLIHYLRKFLVDPNFAAWQSYPRNLIALVYNDDPSVAQEAPWYGVTWTVYTPQLVGFDTPQVKGVALPSNVTLLPQDWPARLASWGIGQVSKIGSPS